MGLFALHCECVTLTWNLYHSGIPALTLSRAEAAPSEACSEDEDARNEWRQRNSEFEEALRLLDSEALKPLDSQTMSVWF